MAADISLAPGAEEVAMAGMLADMLKANLEKPEKMKVFNSLRTTAYLYAEDAEAGMTMDFDKGKLVVYGGKEGKPKLEIATDAATLLELANLKIKMGMPYYFDELGRSVLSKLMKRQLKIKGLLTHPIALTKVTKVMSLN
jgi:SCP-2 sterol transfer family